MMLYGPARPRPDGLGGLQRVMRARMMDAGLPEAAAWAWGRVMAMACRGVCWWIVIERLRKEYALRSMDAVPAQLEGFFKVTAQGLALTEAGHAWIAARAGKETQDNKTQDPASPEGYAGASTRL